MTHGYNQCDYCPLDDGILGRTTYSGMASDHRRLVCAQGHLWYWCPGDKGTAAHKYCQPYLVREH